MAGWDIISSQLGEFIDVIPAQQRIGSDWYKGTADAIYQNIYAIQDCNPEHILILAGDHIYKMNYSEMLKFHNEHKADVTVACLPINKEASKDFGVIEADDHGNILGFQEKPDKPRTIPEDPSKIYASMGIYLFSKDVLLNELTIDAKKKSQHDFGKNIIPQMLKSKRKVCVYNFTDKDGSARYWRDIGTRDAYYQANMDLLKSKPSFNLYKNNWPVRTYHEQYPPIKTLSTKSKVGKVVNSMVSGGCVIEGAVVEHSVLSPNVRIKERAHVKNSVIMESVKIGEGAQIQNAIIDKQVVIPPNTKIGFDVKADKRRFAVTASGVVIVPKKEEIF